MNRYKLRTSVGVDADVVAGEFKRIHKDHGMIAPRVVVDEARPESAPLHPAFTWDDERAAENYRLIEARNLIRAVHVVDHAGEDKGCAFVHVSVESDGEDAKRGYMPREAVVEIPDLFVSAVRELTAKLEQQREALEDLQRYAEEQGKASSAIRRIQRAAKSTGVAVRELGAIV